jgi:Calcineurin-like phosphoesterase
MLAQVLNRDFVLGMARASEQELNSIIANRESGLFTGPPTELDDISTDELRQLAALLAEAAEREEAAKEAAAPPEAEGAPPPPKDDYAYVPRDPLLGLFQSSLEGYAADALPVEEEQMLDDRRSGPVPVVTDRRLAGVDLRLSAEGRRLWGRMEVAHPKILSDPRWILSVVSMAKRRVHGRAPFVERPGEPPPLADCARIVVVGDWGSGLPRAIEVADRIKKELGDPEAARRQKHVIHLGDVYYGGEKREYLENFLAPWPVAPGTTGVASYTLNGNHDMYAGGQDYFGTALADARFACQGGSSMFVLANEHWQFLGLDTAYEEGGLYGDQAAWISRMRREHPDRKTVLLSHHQLFSAYEPGAQELRRKIRPVLDEQEVDAWFWGHEHRCLAYRDRERVRFASCVGHGGIPEYLVKQPPVSPQGLVYEYRLVHGEGWQPWITFGFVVLDVDGPRIHARYVDEDGNEHWSTDLP